MMQGDTLDGNQGSTDRKSRGRSVKGLGSVRFQMYDKKIQRPHSGVSWKKIESWHKKGNMIGNSEALRLRAFFFKQRNYMRRLTEIKV